MRIDNHGYTFVEAIGRYNGSTPDYIQRQCDLALEDGAPLDATSYYTEDGDRRVWRTTDDILLPDVRTALNLPDTVGSLSGWLRAELEGFAIQAERVGAVLKAWEGYPPDHPAHAAMSAPGILAAASGAVEAVEELLTKLT